MKLGRRAVSYWSIVGKGGKKGRALTVGNRDLPIPTHRLTPDTQEEDNNNDISNGSIGCNVFDCAMISRESLTKSSPR